MAAFAAGLEGLLTKQPRANRPTKELRREARVIKDYKIIPRRQVTPSRA